MAEKKEVSGILISDAEGNLYNIPDDDLAKFLVAKDKVDEVLQDAENVGLEPPELGDVEVPPGVGGGPVINIFVGGAPVAGPVEPASFAPSTMAKYAGGSTMAKYAGGSTMAKYAGGSTMAKYAGGSTMVVTRYGRKRTR